MKQQKAKISWIEQFWNSITTKINPAKAEKGNKMNIETKYNIGDEVFTMSNNRIVKAKVVQPYLGTGT